MHETFNPHRPAPSSGLKGINVVTLGALLLAVIAVASSMFAAINMQYAVSADVIRIRSGLTTKEIPLDQVTDVWRPEQLTGGVRVFGTATSNLRTGKFRFNETGNIQLYATRLNTLVVIDTPEGRFGLTPEDPDALIAAIESRTPATFQPVGGPGKATASMLVPLALVLVAVVATVFATGTVGRFPKALRYEVGPDGITIRTGLSPVHIRYDEVEKVELASPKGFPVRIVGTAVGSLLWGRFRWPAAGPNLRMYATRMKPIVLLHLRDGRTFGISPEEDERFVATVQQRLK